MTLGTYHTSRRRRPQSAAPSLRPRLGIEPPEPLVRPFVVTDDPSSPRPFDMGTHRRWFGDVCGENGRKIGRLVKEGRV